MQLISVIICKLLNFTIWYIKNICVCNHRGGHLISKKIVFILCMPLLIISACNNQTTSEKIYTHLEEAVKLEKEFEDQQDLITDLEVKEQEIYSQIIDLGMEEFDQIVELADQAIDIIKERETLIENEMNSIEASKEEFIKIEPLLEELEKGEIRDKGKEMFEVMISRYSSYEELNKEYLNSLQKEEELYENLKEEDLEQEQLTDQINQINDSYQQVLKANEDFNYFTIEYNDLKREFYNLAELDVTYEEEK